MNLCIPITEDQGMKSQVCAHFGSAPMFLIVDTETLVCRAVPNKNQHHGHGMCQPLLALENERIEGVIVGGIGMGALNKLMMAGVQVFLSEHPTVRETVEAFKAGTLKPMQPGMACGQHGHGPHGHGHGESDPHGPCSGPRR